MCFGSPNAADTAARLAERGVPAWKGGGRVRISVHGCNAVGDVEACLAAPGTLRALA